MSFCDKMAVILIVWTVLFLALWVAITMPPARASPLARSPGTEVILKSHCVEGVVRERKVTGQECFKGASRATARPLQQEI